MCIDEVLDAVRRLEQLANPKEPATIELTITDALTQLDGISLTIRNACQVVTILTGQPLKPSTVRSWEHRGHITANGQFGLIGHLTLPAQGGIHHLVAEVGGQLGEAGNDLAIALLLSLG